ncbi:TonB-dependent receptor [Mucilaginibacter ginkgonis]|uniref:TonB-dependent receptor n=1 Tax=Mucilaginibacter ginkgonis TaxID=2682091 RepID=A0A6I4HVE0_9SPHI|nr:TonB-dependent receptor [Mucilaginibacter ginkgonis]QQL50451.1 TonB-dependent receptor [Mucilaginibacter ginkgonis]
MKKFYLIMLFFIFKNAAASAQVAVVTAKFDNAGVKQFTTEIERQTAYKFFYDPIQMDSLRVTFTANALPVDSVLKTVFKNTSYNFAIDGKRVFLTKGKIIITQLAKSYGAAGFKQPAQSANISTLNNSMTDGGKTVVATTANKTYDIGLKTNEFKTGNAVLAGYLRDVKSGEAIVGASIYVPELKAGVASDQFGYYSFTLPRGMHTLVIKGIGMKDARRQIALYSDGKLDIDLQEQVTTLKEVKISSERVANVRSTELGVNRLDISSIKQVPTAFGESDVLRVVLTLPGVQSVGEATTGFNVRGGAADQNLILLNDMTIYNPSHFFGFFSAFDPDIVKDIELYKSSIPEKYGGRLSSVLDVTDREGNKKKFEGSAGIGLITSRINLEGPIDSGRTSFIFGARTTYANWLLSTLPRDYRNSRVSFYDVSFNLSHKIDAKNDLYLTSYLSHDNFKLNSDTAYGYNNKNIALKWKHNYNNKLYSVLTTGYDRYDYNVKSDVNPVNAYNLNFNINQSNFKADFTYYPNPKHTVGFGLSSIYYKLNPGSNQPLGSASLLTPDVVPPEQALESALYLGDKYDITPNFTINAGVRYSLYNFLGPYTVNNYAPNLPKETVNLLNSTTYGSGKVINTYHGPEVRLSARYAFGDNFSVKAGYNTLRQYIHLLSNTTAISPTDVYQLSDPNIKPQFGQQLSLGLYKNLENNTIETSVEVYYKKLTDYLDYKSGAVLVLNHHIETDVLPTQGKAYGVEFFVKKTAGKLNGWLSYTYSRTFLRQDDPSLGTLINGGAYYPANFDKPHAVNFTGNYRFKHRYSMSLNATYSTGRPITLPISRFYYDGGQRILYSDRNQYRIPDYFRTDLSFNIDGNHKVHQRFHNSWSFGVYNLTGRKNAYSTYFLQENGVVNAYKLSIFANPIPFINFNIKF